MAQLEHLRTPSEPPWIDRVHTAAPDKDPRDPFDRDRDRILHSRAFRRLQHKTQVLIVTEGDDYRTRITHSLEVAQIARSIARLLGLSEPLAEAIALGHDVGHTPFGHQGEETLGKLLGGEGWNSNGHSLLVLDELEIQYADHPGLDLTWATREGIARHKTKYDEPIEGFSEHQSASLECQVVNLADPLAYVTHDLHDALDYGLLTTEQLDSTGNELWTVAWRIAKAQFDLSHPEDKWPGVDPTSVKYRVVHRQLINMLINDVLKYSTAVGESVASLAEARDREQAVVDQSPKRREQRDSLLDFMFKEVYKSPLVARQNSKTDKVLRDLYQALLTNDLLLPVYVRELIQDSPEKRNTFIAHYLASLSDRGALDLFAELFEPQERAMGRHVR